MPEYKPQRCAELVREAKADGGSMLEAFREFGDSCLIRAASRTAIPELLAEVHALRAEPASPRECPVCHACETHDVPAEIARLRSQLALARRITPFSAEPCPLCEHADGRCAKPCSMHARIDELSTTIERQRVKTTSLETALLESVAEAQRASAVVDAARLFCAALDRLRCANTQADRERMRLERQYAMRDLERAVARSQPKPVENSTPTSKGPI